MCSTDIVRRALADRGALPEIGVDGREAPGTASLTPDLLTGLRRVQDLTHLLTPEFPVFPAYPPFRARALATVEESGFAAQELCFAEHTGTHLDAPSHFFGDGRSAEHLSPAELIVPLAVVSIAERAARDHDTRLTVADLQRWEERHGRIPPGAVVALHTGWEERVHDSARFLNLDAAGVSHTPGFGREAAEFLVHERSVAGVATDTLSLDVGATTSYDVHRVVLGAGRYGLENVAHLRRVPPSGAVVVVGAPKHRGATGGPARLLALY
jgi:kynurenine formamidase